MMPVRDFSWVHTKVYIHANITSKRQGVGGHSSATKCALFTKVTVAEKRLQLQVSFFHASCARTTGAFCINSVWSGHGEKATQMQRNPFLKYAKIEKVAMSFHFELQVYFGDFFLYFFSNR